MFDDSGDAAVATTDWGIIDLLIELFSSCNKAGGCLLDWSVGGMIYSTLKC